MKVTFQSFPQVNTCSILTDISAFSTTTWNKMCTSEKNGILKNKSGEMMLKSNQDQKNSSRPSLLATIEIIRNSTLPLFLVQTVSYIILGMATGHQLNRNKKTETVRPFNITQPPTMWSPIFTKKIKCGVFRLLGSIQRHFKNDNMNQQDSFVTIIFTSTCHRLYSISAQENRLCSISAQNRLCSIT